MLNTGRKVILILKLTVALLESREKGGRGDSVIGSPLELLEFGHEGLQTYCFSMVWAGSLL
jgi:hypothetical protein